LKKTPITVYWCPASSLTSSNMPEWNLFYDEPVNLFKELMRDKNPEARDTSYLSCPAVSSRLKNTYVFRSNVTTECTYDLTDMSSPKLLTKPFGVQLSPVRPGALKHESTLELSMRFWFFSEEPLVGMINPPMFHKPSYTNYATSVPGMYEIDKWFRPFVLELRVWDKAGHLLIKENDPLFYFEALTDRQVELKRFTLSEELQRLSESCVKSPVFHGKHLPLVERYKRFLTTRTNELVLREIKKNLV